jgi:hypothetical protein
MVAMIVVRCDVPEEVKQDLSTLVNRDDRKGIRAAAVAVEDDDDGSDDDDSDEDDDDGSDDDDSDEDDDEDEDGSDDDGSDDDDSDDDDEDDTEVIPVVTSV